MSTSVYINLTAVLNFFIKPFCLQEILICFGGLLLYSYLFNLNKQKKTQQQHKNQQPTNKNKQPTHKPSKKLST